MDPGTKHLITTVLNYGLSLRAWAAWNSHVHIEKLWFAAKPGIASKNEIF